MQKMYALSPSHDRHHQLPYIKARYQRVLLHSLSSLLDFEKLKKMAFTLEARKLIVERMDKQFASDLDARRKSNIVRKKATGKINH